MTIQEKIDLLSKPIWSLKELMDYFGIKSRTTGIRVKNQAFMEHYGATPYGHQYVRREAILAVYGVNASEETKKLKEMLNEED